MCHGQILSDAIRKARKDHTCTECGRSIPAGRRYRYSVFVADRGERPDVNKECIICASMIENVLNDGCYYSGELVQETHEHRAEGGWRAVLSTVRRMVKSRRGWKRPAEGGG